MNTVYVFFFLHRALKVKNSLFILDFILKNKELRGYYSDISKSVLHKLRI